MATFPGIGERFGEYRVLRQLGRGGISVVFAAQRPGLDRRVALKVMAPELAQEPAYRRRFIREAAALAQLDSPHIIHIYDHGESQGCLFIVTQIVHGGDLAQYLAQHGPLQRRQALTLVAQIASAVAAAHAVAVIHRDIKPSNVLLRGTPDEELFVYLCDFGIARTTSQTPSQTTGVVGSLEYIAPERFAGNAASVQSDIYAIGCLLWTALTGSAPYQGTDLAIMRGHLEKPVPQLTDDGPGSSEINAILRKTLAKNPGDRYPSASELREELAYAESLVSTRTPLTAPATERPDSSSRPTASRIRRRLLALLLVGVLSAALVTAIIITIANQQPLSELVRHSRPDQQRRSQPGHPPSRPVHHLSPRTLLSTARPKGGGSRLFAINVVSGEYHRVALDSPGMVIESARLPTISPDRSSFIYLVGASSAIPEEPRIKELSGGDRPLFTRQSPCQLGFRPAFRPDGEAVAVVCLTKTTGALGLYVVDMDGNVEETLLTDGTPEGGPTWSTGGRVVFMRDLDGHEGLWSVLPSDPRGTLTQVTNSPNRDMCPDWSPRHGLLFVRTDSTGHSDVWVMPRYIEEPYELFQLTERGDVECPTWSPDGQSIAFLSGPAKHHLQLMLMNWDGGDVSAVPSPKGLLLSRPPGVGFSLTKRMRVLPSPGHGER